MTKAFILSILLSAGTSATQAQSKINFSYDANGNRMHREFSLHRVAKPTDKTDSLNAPYLSMGPNPTPGSFQVRVNNYNEHTGGTISLYDLTGKLLARKEHIYELNEFDLSAYPNGTYVLDVLFGEEKTQYEVVKAY